MFSVEALILITGVLILLGIASSKLSARAGLPALVLFLALGMLAGDEGIGGLRFDNYELAYGIGTIALAFILFDGGLSTSFTAFRRTWKPAMALATVGVLITSLITGLAATMILGLNLLQGMLLGSIIGSTDAAAVFAVLRSGGVRLPERLSATLEVESASNDPMAIFLTIGLIEVLLGQTPLGIGLLALFVKQMVIGGGIGLAVGFLAVWLINRINLVTTGLYPVLASACCLLTFGIAAILGGSGFLAVYVAGIILGNNTLVLKRSIFMFHDALAWLSQIIMFVVLGLLSVPSRLMEVAGEGLLIAVILMFISRPVAIFLTLLPLLPFGIRYSWRDLIFLCWGGLKGAVPITLATFPLIYHVPGALLYFDVVFFVVLISALFQGWTMAPLARALGLQRPPEPTPPVTLEISSLRHVEGDIVDYYIGPDSHPAGRLVRELALPEGAVIALIARGDQVIPPQGNTRILAEDHVVVVLNAEARPLVDRVFARGPSGEDLPTDVEFPLRATTRVGEFEEFYGFAIDAPSELTLEEAILGQLEGKPPEVGHIIPFGPVALRIREVDASGRITRVGMMIVPTDPEAPPSFVNPQRRGTKWWSRPSKPRI